MSSAARRFAAAMLSLRGGALAVVAVLGVLVAAPATASAATPAPAVLLADSFSAATAQAAWATPAVAGGANAACLTAATQAPGSLVGCTPNPAPAGSGALELTGSAQSAIGSIFATSALSTSAGLDASFTTYQFGGSGADGISLDLTAVDPSNPVVPAAAGPSGGQLGYAPSANVNGLSHGYLGIGFDVYGNYENSNVNGTGCAVPAPLALWTAYPQSVSVRGPGNGTSGYCLLSTTATTSANSAWGGSNLPGGQRLDAPSATSPSAAAVPVEVAINPTSTAYVARTSGLTVAAKSYLVAYQPIGSTSWTVADSLTGPLPSVTNDPELAGADFPSSWIDAATGIPSLLAIGLSGTTGGSTETHEVTGLTVTSLTGATPALVPATTAGNVATADFTSSSSTGDWVTPVLAAGANTACLTAGTVTTATPIPGCGLGATDPVGGGALQLTTNGGYLVGSVFHSTSVPTTAGLDFAFDTYQYDGSGADGISFDLAATNPTNSAPPAQAGPTGGSLGYAPRYPQGGLTDGYLGFGLDVYGNYENSNINGSGCTTPAGLAANTAYPESVSVRGPGNGLNGYCLLSTSATAAHVSSSGASNLPGAARLDSPTATSRALVKVPVEVVLNPTTAPIQAATSGLTVAPKSYLIADRPLGTTSWTSADALTGLLPTISNNAELASSDFPRSWINPVTGIPYALTFGWSASTGGWTEFHAISNFTTTSVTAAVPNLSVTAATPLHDTVTAGGTTPLSITATVNSTGAAELDPVVVTTTVPATMHLGTPSTTGSPWSCAPPLGQSITCTDQAIGGIAAGTALPSFTIPVTTSASSSGSQVITTQVAADDAPAQSVTTPLTVQAGLATGFCTAYFTGAVSSAWENLGNWSATPGGDTPAPQLPGVNSVVCLAQHPVRTLITLNSSLTVAAVEFDAAPTPASLVVGWGHALTLTSGFTSVIDALTVSGDVVTVGATGTLQVTTLADQASNVAGPGSLVLATGGSSSFSNKWPSFTGGLSVVNDGQATLAPDTFLYLYAGSSLTNAGTLTLGAGSDLCDADNSAEQLVNTGTLAINATSADPAMDHLPTTNAGTLEVTEGTFTEAATFVDTSTAVTSIAVGTSQITSTSTATNAGTLSVSAPSAVTIGAPLTLMRGPKILGAYAQVLGTVLNPTTTLQISQRSNAVTAVATATPRGSRLSTGSSNICLVTQAGAVLCTGSNAYGLVGNNSSVSTSSFVPVAGISTAVSVSVGYYHACAVLQGGGVDCWGDNSNGQLGNGTTTNSSVPVAVTGITNAVEVATGEYNTCALLATGTVECWGLDNTSQNGDGLNSWDDTTPIPVRSLSGVTAISLGGFFGCALLSTGTVDCWGYNNLDQLGGATAATSLPVQIPGLTSVTALAAGYASACATTASGLWCWGDNANGELGNGTAVNAPTPVLVPLTAVSSVAMGYASTCATTSAGALWCWGYNSNGQLGLGNGNQQLAPVKVPGLAGVTAVSVGWGTTVVATSAGSLEGVGLNSSGQLGNHSTSGTSTYVTIPSVTY